MYNNNITCINNNNLGMFKYLAIIFWPPHDPPSPKLLQLLNRMIIFGASPIWTPIPQVITQPRAMKQMKVQVQSIEVLIAELI